MSRVLEEEDLTLAAGRDKAARVGQGVVRSGTRLGKGRIRWDEI